MKKEEIQNRIEEIDRQLETAELRDLLSDKKINKFLYRKLKLLNKLFKLNAKEYN